MLSLHSCEPAAEVSPSPSPTTPTSMAATLARCQKYKCHGFPAEFDDTFPPYENSIYRFFSVNVNRVWNASTLPPLANYNIPSIYSPDITWGPVMASQTVSDESLPLNRQFQERLDALLIPYRDIFMRCGTDPVYKNNLLNLLEHIQSRGVKAGRPHERMMKPLFFMQPLPASSTVRRRGGAEFWQCLWGGCGNRQKKLQRAIEHFFIDHVVLKFYECSIDSSCSISFSRAADLYKHQRNRHNIPRPRERAYEDPPTIQDRRRARRKSPFLY